MKFFFALLSAATLSPGQTAPGDPFSRAEQVLEWYVAAPDTGSDAWRLGVRGVEVTSRQLSPDASPQVVEKFRADLQGRQQRPLVYRTEAADGALLKAIETAAKLGAELMIIPAHDGQLAQIVKASAYHKIKVAIDATSGPMLDVERALRAVAPYKGQVRVWVSPSAWERAGTRPLAAIYMLREHLAGATLEGQRNDEFVREAYRLDIKPLVWSVPSSDLKRAGATLDQLVGYHQNYASRTRGIRRLGEIAPDERQKIEAALPGEAPAQPQKARKLLVFDLNVGRFGHPSIPYANLAMQLMGRKTGAFEATVSSDPAMLQPAKLKEFDAVYLNNTIGDIFSTAEARDAFADFVRNGGGVMGNHATTVTMTEWPEFGEILGARGASHRMTDERVVIEVEEPANPIVKAFGSGPFEYEDEIFRFQSPYSRDKVRVLLSVNPDKTDMNQGRCYGQCYRDDNDYPVAWIRQYGKGRVFYTTLGHNPHVFWQPNMLRMFLAAAQYVLGDLQADATPAPRKTTLLERVLPSVAEYDWGDDELPVRRLERAISLIGRDRKAAQSAEQQLLATLKATSKAGAKDAITRQLSIVGSSVAVPALATMLTDQATADMARYALERIEGDEAIQALRGALAKSTDVRLRTGLIHSLARRKDVASVPEFQTLMMVANPAVAAAATNALGMIATPEAIGSLLKAKLNQQTADALLNAAETAKGTRAERIYAKLLGSEAADEVRVAAIHGMGREGNAQALEAALRDASPNVQSAALAHTPAALLASRVNQLPPSLKIEALAALRSRPSARPAFLAALQDGSAHIRIAAIEGLATVATEGDVAALVNLGVNTSGDEQAAARLALYRAPGLDSAIAAMIGSAQGKQKLELIRAAGERANHSAGDAILAAAQHTDPTVRREAVRALRGIARPEQSASILAMLLKSDEDDRSELERTLATALGRAEKLDLQPVVNSFTKIDDSEMRASLVAVMALTGDSSALPPMRKALETGDASVQRAAVLGLSEWTSPEPMADLLNVARTSSNAALKSLALRGYIRLLQRPVGRPPAETAKLLEEAMSLASRPEDKKAVLAAVQRVITRKSLEIARAAASDPSVSAEAKLAESTLERALAERGQ